MGICGERDKGRQQWVTYDCVGKGKEDIITNEFSEVRESLEKAMKKMGITMKEINAVTYSYNPLNINNTVFDCGIPNGGILTIQLKSTY